MPADAVLAVPPEERTSIKDWYIVTLRDDAPDPGRVAADLQRDQGVLVSHVYRLIFKGFAAKLPTGAVEGLRRNPLVASITPDVFIELDAQQVPPGVHRVEAAPAFKNATAKIDGINEQVNVDVAVLYTGIDRDHPDLNYAGGASYLDGGIDCTSGGRPGVDGTGHGTHVAGIIGAKDNDRGVVGVAPGARVWSVKVLDSFGLAVGRSVLCGIEHVIENAAIYEVANMSLSGGQLNADDGQCGHSSLALAYNQWHDAICTSVAAGVTYVVAAGNKCGDAAHRYPAAFDEVITVSAMVDTDGQPGGGGGAGQSLDCNFEQGDDQDDSLARFSNYGADVDLAAPGVDVRSTDRRGDYAILDGTRMAAPHVAGAAALFKATHPSATPGQVRAALLAEAEPLSQPLPDDPDGIAEPVLNVNDGQPWSDPTPPTGPVLSLIEVSEAGNDPDQHVVGATLYYNNSARRQGRFTVAATTSDVSSGISRVVFPQAFGEPDTTDTAEPYQATYNWNATSDASGTRPVTSYNGQDMSATALMTLVPDRTDPSATISDPPADTTIGNGQVIRVTANDNNGGSGIAEVEVRYCDSNTCNFADGTSIGVDAAAPYQVAWTAQPADGNYWLIARAKDNVDNRDVSAKVKVTVANGAARAAATGSADGASGDADETLDTPSDERSPDDSLPVASAGEDLPATTTERPLRIVRHGGLDAAGAARAYDGRRGTAWMTERREDYAAVWFDLGKQRSVAAIRWIVTKSSPAEVQVSSDGKRRIAVGRNGDVPAGEWQTLVVDETARYVRFVFISLDGRTRLGYLAEVEIYGPPAAANEETSHGNGTI